MATGAGEAEVKLFTRQELATRNSKRDAVLIIHNSVYDVTKFLEEHPGGEEVLLERAGQDATEPFEDVGHSSDGRALMKKYKIGEVVAAERVESAPRDTQWADGDEQRAAGAAASGASAWVAPLVLGVLATLLYRYLFL